MKGDNYLTYIKYVDTKNYASSILEFQFKGFLFVLFFALNNFILGSLSSPAWLYLFLLIIMPLLLTLITFPLIKKAYYKNYLKRVRKDKKERNELLGLIHKEELSNSIVSDEIHDLLKLYLSNQEYIILRKKGLTYDNTKELVDIKEDEDRSRLYLEDKYSVSLNSKQIINLKSQILNKE
ncbi:hypothetical protein ACTOJ1_000656 [Shigella flexneri]